MNDLIKELSARGDDPAGMEERLERIRAAAAAEGLIDIAYSTLDSPFGQVLVAAGDRGVVRIALPNEDFDLVLQDLAGSLSPRVLERRAPIDPVLRQLDQYFNGDLRRFKVDLDWRLVRGKFGRRVLEQTALLPYGQTASYSEVAAQAGNQRASRAAGSALGANPIPIIIPCHRVRRTGGNLGGYRGGLEMKQALLEMEGVDSVA